MGSVRECCGYCVFIQRVYHVGKRGGQEHTVVCSVDEEDISEHNMEKRQGCVSS